MFNRIGASIATALFSLLLAFPLSAETVELPGLSQPAEIVRDEQGIAHIRAASQEDLYYLQGWVHAEDRLFQMDLSRRQPSGTLAELFGPGSLAGDVELRTIGLRRAAERSKDVLSRETIEALEAYARGVNDWVMLNPNGLPPEYAFLGFTEREDFRPWNVVDSIVIAKLIAFGLSFDLDTGLTQRLEAYVGELGPIGALVFSQDVFRSQPFDCASTVPDATGEYPFEPAPPMVPNPFACPDATVETVGKGKGKARGRDEAGGPAEASAAARGRGSASAAVSALAGKASAKLRRSPYIQNVLDADGEIGSNEWGITRALGANGRPIIANDPHLALNTPSTFYPMGLEAPGLNVFGSTFPGVAFVVLGHNKHIHWGATTNPMDVTDTFFELLAFDETGTPVATIFQGQPEPVELIPETFFYSDGSGGLVEATGVPAATIIVPRRNQGPIITTLADPAPGATIPALSVQYTGFSATRELDTFRLWNEARNLNDFKEGLQYFDFGSQNWVYGDNAGNVAYFASAEMPIRTDLHQGTVAPGNPAFFPPGAGIPPWLIRDGTRGAHEWLPVENPQPGQAIPYEILRQDELPHTVNPPAGWFVNANNDPAGTVLDNDPLNQLRKGGEGIYYLNPGYAGGFRAGTITNRVREYVATQGELSQADLKSIQADVSLLDAKYFVPFITAAFDNAGASGVAELEAFAADDELSDAIDYLRDWDFTTPTGIQAGYDAGDPVVASWTDLPEPSEAEIAHSVAATIYSMWRGQAVRSIVDTPLNARGLPTPGNTEAMTSLQHLIRSEGGLGVIPFFEVPGLSDFDDRRDYLLLAALRSALDLLASDEFAPAFGATPTLADYRWGKLHRIVLDHPFIGPASLPAQGGFPQPVPGLPGFPTDGGFNVVDASSHSARADGLNDFMFGSGPVRRFTSEPQGAFRSNAESVWAGGTSGVPSFLFGIDNPFYGNLLNYWLVNETLPLVLRARDAD
ncbi:penicillin acylase family protein [Lentisalinibacter salinarum]|uniref:penicillin acylase family protein n=1 Tax=Lentisalinibacter salinarum TaxID=2992239 RepID=UPI003868E4F6